MRLAALVRRVGLLIAIYPLDGCQLGRPDGAFVPAAADTEVDPDANDEIDEDLYGDAAPLPDLDTNPRNDAGDGGRRDGGSAQAGGDDPPAESPLSGDYWMRTEVQTNDSVSQPPITIRSTSTITTYSLVRVGFQQRQLKFFDWQCALKFEHSCTSGCSTISTSFGDPAQSGRAFAAAQRDLLVEGDTWSATRAPYALGWRGDFAVDPQAELPVSESDPLVYDPDGGGKGVDLETTVRLSSGLSSSCSQRFVQKVDVSYAGTLDDGAFAGGSLTDHGTQQTVLSTSCGDAQAETREVERGLQLVAAPEPIEGSLVPWPCPSLSAFEAAFADL